MPWTPLTHPLADQRSRPVRDARDVVVPIAIVTAVAVAERLTGDTVVLLGLLSVGAPLAAASLTATGTARVAAYAVVLAVALTTTARYPVTSAHAVGCVAVASVGLVSFRVAVRRQRHEDALQRVSRVAQAAQREILRPIPNRVGPADVAVRYLSATPDALVGGDLYEVLEKDGDVHAIVGDVRGKGLEAMSLAMSVLRAFRDGGDDRARLDAVVDHIEAAVAPDCGIEDFVTAVLVDLSPTGRLTVANCGHPPPLRIRGDEVVALAATRPSCPFGLGPSVKVDVHQLVAGDRVLLHTDGLIEARNRRGTFFPLGAELAQVTSRELDGTLEALMQSLHRFTGDSCPDDVALLLLEFRPQRRSASKQGRSQHLRAL